MNWYDRACFALLDEAEHELRLFFDFLIVLAVAIVGAVALTIKTGDASFYEPTGGPRA